MDYKIVPYHEGLEREWDRFVMQESANGTFLQTRRFLNYHPKDRFLDASCLLVNQKNAIAAVCPAALFEKNGKKVCVSHPGSTYGGIVIRKSYFDNVDQVLNILKTMDNYFMLNYRLHNQKPLFFQ